MYTPIPQVLHLSLPTFVHCTSPRGACDLLDPEAVPLMLSCPPTQTEPVIETGAVGAETMRSPVATYR